MTQKLPLPIGDRAAFIRKATVALEIVDVPTMRVVTYNISYDRVEAVDLPVSRVAEDANTKDQFYVDGAHISGGPPAMAQIHLSWLRERALESGATPDAIRLLGKATKAFTKQEETKMAEKLKAKSAAKADKEGLKAAAKKAPVAKGAKIPVRGGNEAALAKARAAKAEAGPRKYTPQVKAKDLELREGSWTRFMVETIIAHKDTHSARDAHKASKEYPNKNLDFGWAAKKNYITFA